MTNYGPWKIWNGGECPVADGVIGQVQLAHQKRNEVEEKDKDDISWYDWRESGRGAIIAYREIIEPEVVRHALKVEYQGTIKYATITVTGHDSIKAEWVD